MLQIAPKDRHTLRSYRGRGYFISPTGELLCVDDAHIRTMIADPERFGLTSAEIERRYAAYRESMGIEGSAREDLLRQVIARGWIRIRHYPRMDRWSVNLPDMSERHVMRVRAFFGAVGAGRYSEVRLDAPDGQERKCEVGDLL